MHCKATYGDDLISREENWRSKVPENSLVAEKLSLRLHHHHMALQAQRLAAKQDLIRQYTSDPLHCFAISRPNEFKGAQLGGKDVVSVRL